MKERSSKSLIRRRASQAPLPVALKEACLQLQLSHLLNTTSLKLAMSNTNRRHKHKIHQFRIQICMHSTTTAIDSNMTLYVKTMHGRIEVTK